MRQERPAFSGRPRQTVLEASDLSDRPRRTGGRELIPQRRIATEEAVPGGVRRQGSQLFPRALLGDHEAGADGAVIEGEDVHPPFFQDVMDGGLLIRVRTGGERRVGDFRKVGEPFEVAEDEGGVRRRFNSGDREVAGEEAAGAGGVDQQVGFEADGSLLMRAVEVPAVSRPCFQAGQLDLFHHLDACRRGLEDEMVIDVRAQPVGVGDGVRGTGGHQDAALVGGAVGVGASRCVAVEGEAPLEAAAEMGEPLLPAPPGGEGVEVVEAVARGEALQADRGERRGGLAEGEARVAVAVEEQHLVPLHLEDAREDRAREAGADDGDSHGRF